MSKVIYENIDTLGNVLKYIMRKIGNVPKLRDCVISKRILPYTP